MKKETLIFILRWIAVIPAAVAAAFGVTLLGYLFSDVDPNYNPLIGFFSSAIFVVAGAYTAPSGRKAVATVLATIKCVLPLIGILFAIITSSVDEYKWYEWLNIVAIIGGSIIAAIYIWKGE